MALGRFVQIEGRLALTLLVDKPVQHDQPAIHALVIGAGAYPYLEDGVTPPLIDSAGMGQLTSPPISAAKLCEWLRTSLRPVDAVLSTIDVLCSGDAVFTDADGQRVLPERATLHNVRAAVHRWFARVNASSDNVALFYFSGHGVTSGDVHSLLMEDFGSDPMDPFSGAVDANAFVDGMRKAVARNQLYLFDTCRTAPETYLRDYLYRGAPLVNPAANAAYGKLNQVVWWASDLGLPAFGRQGSATVFLDAFLESVKGASAVRDLERDAWLVQAAKLAEGMNTYIARVIGKQRQHVTSGRGSFGFPIHALSGDPIVPVEVACKPQSRAVEVELRCSSGHSRGPGVTGVWHFELPYGTYEIHALQGQDVIDTQPCPANPPIASVVVRV